MHNVKNEIIKINHCLDASLFYVFNFLGIPIDRISPSPTFLQVDYSLISNSINELLHSLIKEITPKEFIEKYAATGISLKHAYKIVELDIYKALYKNKFILLFIDVYNCSWCRFYNNAHFDHICIITDFKSQKIEIVDPIFSITPFYIEKDIILKYGKSFFQIYNWKEKISYVNALEKQIAIMKVYDKWVVEINKFNNLLLSIRQYILESFFLEDFQSYLIVNFFKQKSDDIKLHMLYLQQCEKEDPTFIKIITIEQEIIHILNNICNNFIKLALGKMNKKENYFANIINLIDKLYYKEIRKKTFYEQYFK